MSVGDRKPSPERKGKPHRKSKTTPTRREERDWKAVWMASTDQRSLRCSSERKPGFQQLMLHKNFTGLAVQDPGLHAHWPKSAFYHGRFVSECSLSHGPSYSLQHVPFGLSAMGENKASSPRHIFDPHCITNDLMNRPFYCQQSCAMHFVKP